ncbi:MAG: hypothetical protein ACI8W3_003546 [Myxococcota bacterium]
MRILRSNVFSDAEASDYAIFKGANFLHTVTREHVIRRQLLIAPGDRLDRELLAATERALRLLEFVNDATVEVIDVSESAVAATPGDGPAALPSSGYVDIVIHTHDAWTIVPGILFESGGGLTEIGLTGSDTNVAGFGKKVWLEGVHHSDVGNRFAAGYRDPQVLGSRWLGSGSFRTGPLLDAVDFSLNRPFYSPDSKWAYSAYGGWRAEKFRLFNAGDEVGRIQESRKRAQVAVARAVGARYRKLTAELLYIYEDAEYDVTEGLDVRVPEDELTLTTFVGLFYREERWVKDKRIRKMTITEDVRLGYQLGARVGRAGFPVPYGEKQWNFSATYQHAFTPIEGHYLFLSTVGSSEEDKNSVLSFGSTYFAKWSRWQTLAINFKLDYGWRLDGSNQFSLGGESGLRGFSARRFNGDKALLLNAETRLFSPVEILTVALGAVAFVDAGRAWAEDQDIKLDEVGVSAGFGMRFGFTRAPNEPTGRIDFGWPLSEGGFALTIGAEQQF